MAPMLHIVPPLARGYRVGVVIIAQGTPFQVTVRDARERGPWATMSEHPIEGRKRTIIYHHTAGGVPAKRSMREEIDLLEMMRNTSPWGLPYNFVVMPAPPFRVYYLNDVAGCWPHTWDHNCDTAIAAYGNFERDKPDQRLVDMMLRLGDALAEMWGEWLREAQHRDFIPTSCPGQHLSPLLPSLGKQRGIDYNGPTG